MTCEVLRVRNFILRPIYKEWTTFVSLSLIFIFSKILINIDGDPFNKKKLVIFGFYYIVCFILSFIPKYIKYFLYVTIYTVAYGLFFIEYFIWNKFNYFFSPTSLTLALGTNKQETKEFLNVFFNGASLFKAMAVTVFLVTSCILMHAYKNKIETLLVRFFSKFRLNIVSIYRWTLALAIIFCLVVTASRAKSIWICINADNTRTLTLESINLANSPFSRFLSACKFVSLSSKDIERLIDRSRNLTIGVSEPICPKLVLIIGESHSHLHSNLYGYYLNTAPFQKKLQNDSLLLAFSDVVTPKNYTTGAFKEFLSTQSLYEKGNYADGYFFPQFLKLAGYYVSFMSNQFAMLEKESACTFYQEAASFLCNKKLSDQIFNFHNKEHNLNRNYDMIFLNEYKDYVENNKKHKYTFDIYHLMGQHAKYKKRYPENFNRFKIKDIKRSDLNDKEKQVVAEYDNACLYVDTCIQFIYERYKDEDAIIIYFSDHGENPYDIRGHKCGRFEVKDINLEYAKCMHKIPFEVMFTEKFKKLHKDIWKNIEGAVDKPFSTDDLPFIFMGLANINSKEYKPEKDLFSPLYRTDKPRYIGSQKKIDYNKLLKQKTVF